MLCNTILFQTMNKKYIMIHMTCGTTNLILLNLRSGGLHLNSSPIEQRINLLHHFFVAFQRIYLNFWAHALSFFQCLFILFLSTLHFLKTLSSTLKNLFFFPVPLDATAFTSKFYRNFENSNRHKLKTWITMKESGYLMDI